MPDDFHRAVVGYGQVYRIRLNVQAPGKEESCSGPTKYKRVAASSGAKRLKPFEFDVRQQTRQLGERIRVVFPMEELDIDLVGQAGEERQVASLKRRSTSDQLTTFQNAAM